MNFTQTINHFQSELKKHADPKRAAGAKAYLKSHEKFYGVDTPTTRSIAKHWLKNHPDMSIDQIVQLAEKLWHSHWHDERMLAVYLLELNLDQLNLKHFPFIQHLITTAHGWAQRDNITVTVVGSLIDHHPNIINKIKPWIKSDNFWLRRAALQAQIVQFRRGEGDFQLFKQFATSQLDEATSWTKDERFFIRKAIGWALRELAPHQPQLVFAFVNQYKDQMSGLTFREATRKLPERYQKQLTQ